MTSSNTVPREEGAEPPTETPLRVNLIEGASGGDGSQSSYDNNATGSGTATTEESGNIGQNGEAVDGDNGEVEGDNWQQVENLGIGQASMEL
jgi:hypothetical protein